MAARNKRGKLLQSKLLRNLSKFERGKESSNRISCFSVTDLDDKDPYKYEGSQSIEIVEKEIVEKESAATKSTRANDGMKDNASGSFLKRHESLTRKPIKRFALAEAETELRLQEEEDLKRAIEASKREKERQDRKRKRESKLSTDHECSIRLQKLQESVVKTMELVDTAKNLKCQAVVKPNPEASTIRDQDLGMDTSNPSQIVQVQANTVKGISIPEPNGSMHSAPVLSPHETYHEEKIFSSQLKSVSIKKLSMAKFLDGDIDEPREVTPSSDSLCTPPNHQERMEESNNVTPTLPERVGHGSAKLKKSCSSQQHRFENEENINITPVLDKGPNLTFKGRSTASCSNKTAITESADEEVYITPIHVRHTDDPASSGNTTEGDGVLDKPLRRKLSTSYNRKSDGERHPIREPVSTKIDSVSGKGDVRSNSLVEVPGKPSGTTPLSSGHRSLSLKRNRSSRFQKKIVIGKNEEKGNKVDDPDVAIMDVTEPLPVDGKLSSQPKRIKLDCDPQPSSTKPMTPRSSSQCKTNLVCDPQPSPTIPMMPESSSQSKTNLNCDPRPSPAKPTTPESSSQSKTNLNNYCDPQPSPAKPTTPESSLQSRTNLNCDPQPSPAKPTTPESSSQSRTNLNCDPQPSPAKPMAPESSSQSRTNLNCDPQPSPSQPMTPESSPQFNNFQPPPSKPMTPKFSLQSKLNGNSRPSSVVPTKPDSPKTNNPQDSSRMKNLQKTKSNPPPLMHAHGRTPPAEYTKVILSSFNNYFTQLALAQSKVLCRTRWGDPIKSSAKQPSDTLLFSGRRARSGRFLDDYLKHSLKIVTRTKSRTRSCEQLNLDSGESSETVPLSDGFSKSEILDSSGTYNDDDGEEAEAPDILECTDSPHQPSTPSWPVSTNLLEESEDTSLHQSRVSSAASPEQESAPLHQNDCNGGLVSDVKQAEEIRQLANIDPDDVPMIHESSGGWLNSRKSCSSSKKKTPVRTKKAIKKTPAKVKKTPAKMKKTPARVNKARNLPSGSGKRNSAAARLFCKDTDVSSSNDGSGSEDASDSTISSNIIDLTEESDIIMDQELSCPICGKKLNKSEIQVHADKCLTAKNDRERNLVECSMCKKKFERSVINIHLEQCDGANSDEGHLFSKRRNTEMLGKRRRGNLSEYSMKLKNRAKLVGSQLVDEESDNDAVVEVNRCTRPRSVYAAGGDQSTTSRQTIDSDLEPIPCEDGGYAIDPTAISNSPIRSFTRIDEMDPKLRAGFQNQFRIHGKGRKNAVRRQPWPERDDFDELAGVKRWSGHKGSGSGRKTTTRKYNWKNGAQKRWKK